MCLKTSTLIIYQCERIHVLLSKTIVKPLLKIQHHEHHRQSRRLNTSIFLSECSIASLKQETVLHL